MKILKPILFTGMLAFGSTVAAAPLSSSALEEKAIKPSVVVDILLIL